MLDNITHLVYYDAERSLTNRHEFKPQPHKTPGLLKFTHGILSRSIISEQKRILRAYPELSLYSTETRENVVGFLSPGSCCNGELDRELLV